MLLCRTRGPRYKPAPAVLVRHPDDMSTPTAFQINRAMRTGSNVVRYDLLTGPVPPSIYAYRLAPGDVPEDDPPGRGRFDRSPSEREDLPYKVELWNEAKTGVEQVLAVTANGSIGYAAYYAATREHPDRYVTLRHKNRIVSRWNGPEH